MICHALLIFCLIAQMSQQIAQSYDTSTAAPTASSAFLSLSTSSFGTFSFRTCGKFSTNFLACQYEAAEDDVSAGALEQVNYLTDAQQRTSTRFMFGMTPLTSLIAFAFCAASIFVSVTVKTVFSFGFSGSAAAAAPAPPAAGAAAAGAATAISAMFKRDCEMEIGNALRVNISLGDVEKPPGLAFPKRARRTAHLERRDELGGLEERQRRDLVHDLRDLWRDISRRRSRGA